MIDTTELHAALEAAVRKLLRGEKARANIPYPSDGTNPRDFFDKVDAAARAWAKTRGVDAHAGFGHEYISIALMGPLKASPLCAKVRKPWHFMEIGEEKIVDGIKVSTLRVYVSLYGKRLDMLFSINFLATSKARLTRIF